MTDIDYTDARNVLSGIDPFGFSDVLQAIGSTLWRVQLLEETVARYLVLKLGFEGTVAREAAEKVFEKAEKRTLGQIVREINDKASVSDEISSRLSAFVNSRNWFVHRSQADCGVLLRTSAGRQALRLRLEEIAEGALAIQKVLASELEAELIQRGVTPATPKSHLMREVHRRTGA